MNEQQFTQPLVSIIIPVYNDSERLDKCLQQLEKQNYPQDKYEVIVVDNGSEESIESVVKNYTQAKVAIETKSGSYAARNKGISLAQGEIIAFTDADCIPNLDWIEKGVYHLLKNDNCGLVGGNINFIYRDDNQRNSVELYDTIHEFQQEFSIKVQNFSVTANLFTFKKILDDVGYFDSDLKSSGDRNWGERVAKKGYKLIYAEDVCISHPARSSLSEIYKKTIRIIDGVEDVRQKKNLAEKLTLKQKYNLFYKHIVMDFFPLKNIIRILKESKLNNLIDKIKVIGVLFFVRYTRNWERLRLRLGKSVREKW